MSVSRSLDLDYNDKNPKSAKGSSLAAGGAGSVGNVRGTKGPGSVTMTRKAHSVTRARAGCKDYH